jgi:hypothetical protein
MIMALGNITENQAIVFFILAFVLIKITYNELSKFVRIVRKRLGIRK